MTMRAPRHPPTPLTTRLQLCQLDCTYTRCRVGHQVGVWWVDTRGRGEAALAVAGSCFKKYFPPSAPPPPPPPPFSNPMLNITRLDVPQRYDACACAAGRCTGTAQRQVPSARSQLPCQREFFAVESCRQCRLDRVDRLDTVESGDSTRKTHAVCENRYSSVHTHRLPSFVMVLCQHSTTLRMGD